MSDPRIIDAYGHVSLPRFLSAEQYIAVLDANGVERAIIATADTCPDLREISRAVVKYPDRLRAVGMPVGATPADKESAIAEQMAAGFLGIRLPAALVASQPSLLDIIGKAGGIPFVVGPSGLQIVARQLTEFLDRYPTAYVCAPHFAGAVDPAILDSDARVRALFAHPRFVVIFSRQGVYAPDLVATWARAVVERVGWRRVLFGSEYPVALWRDETYSDTLKWIETAGLSPSAEERDAFVFGNAEQYLFRSKLQTPRLVDERWCGMQGKQLAPGWLFPQGSLDIPEDVHRRLISTYLEQGGDAVFGSYRAFIVQLLAKSV